MIKNILIESDDIFLSIEEREVYSGGRAAEPGLLRIITKNDSRASFVAAPQFQKYQEKCTRNKFNLSKAQFDMFNAFFSEYSHGDLIETCMVRLLVFVCLEKKSMVWACDQDVIRALSCFGDQMTADDFLNFLSLFFASEFNLAERIRCFLAQQNESSNCLTPEQAAYNYAFLNKFYGVNATTRYFDTLQETIPIKNFVKLVYPCLKLATFVKW